MQAVAEALYDVKTFVHPDAVICQPVKEDDPIVSPTFHLYRGTI